MKRILITGGAGFIGTNLVESFAKQECEILVIDKAHETWNRKNFCDLAENLNVRLVAVDLQDQSRLQKIFEQFVPECVIHLAAESHVDKSIAEPMRFLKSNVEGTYTLLDVAKEYWETQNRFQEFRFHYCSTDEVYGSLGPMGAFHETLPLHPNNPYSATKAAGEHLVTAWANTFGLPVLITRCSNNYGSYQGPDKFIPLTIGRCVREEPVLIHGTGQNVRDWIHVDDHVRAIQAVIEQGKPGEMYNIGGGSESERTNLQIAEMICDFVDECLDNTPHHSRDLITFVKDRPGNDFRYSMDSSKLDRHTGWKQEISLETGLRDTVKWYIENNNA
ncbi:MAG: dTDP-glucose 4,6-dehydratase [Planctomycetaceae bacterium]|nr:dTDP-glucose 4,6-dehydratase [Planctomycetaceae bacterium]